MDGSELASADGFARQPWPATGPPQCRTCKGSTIQQPERWLRKRLSAGSVTLREYRSGRQRAVAPFFACLVIYVMVPTSADAYVDPGHGTLLWQAALAGFFGAMFYLRKVLAKLRAKRRSKESEKETYDAS